MAGLVNDDTELGGFIHLGHHDGTFVTMALVEFCEVLERVVANDVGVENEEWRIILAQDFLGQLQRPRSAQGFGFDGESNFDVVLFLVLNSRIIVSTGRKARTGTHLLEGRHHHIRTIVDGQHDIRNARSSQALDLVQNH